MTQQSTTNLVARLAMSEGRDIIVLGGSAGAIQALNRLLPEVNPELPAAIFIVVHAGQESPGYLAGILERVTSLPVRYAEDMEPIELGTVYVAPPDRHLLVKPGMVRVVRGPKENNFRPAIDPLFRSAAYTYGNRVIGGVLSGLLDDGSHGLYQIKHSGGITMAQDPRDAQQPNMPLSAIAQVGVDHIVSAEEMGKLLNTLTSVEDTDTNGPITEQLDIAEGAASGLQVPNRGACSALVCPECNGALWEVKEGDLVRYRCHVGHGYTGQTLGSLKDVEIEQALWTSVRLLEEQAELQRNLSEKPMTPIGRQLQERFLANSMDRRHAAELVRSLLTGRKELPENAEQNPNIEAEYKGEQ
jgi:two-component system chemotaxis response regulator CheB